MTNDYTRPGVDPWWATATDEEADRQAANLWGRIIWGSEHVS